MYGNVSVAVCMFEAVYLAECVCVAAKVCAFEPLFSSVFACGGVCVAVCVVVTCERLRVPVSVQVYAISYVFLCMCAPVCQ